MLHCMCRSMGAIHSGKNNLLLRTESQVKSLALFLLHRIMARSIDESFYKTPAWRRCRAAYIQKHPLCEKCLEIGIITPSKYVHHKTFLTQDNCTDASIAYGEDNLQALCYSCHEKEHERKKKRRFRVGLNGEILPA